MRERNTIGRGFMIEGQAITWAGLCPWTDGLSFGTLDGLWATSHPGQSGNQEGFVAPIIIALDAVNGVGSVENYLCGTSRASVFLGERNGGDDFEMRICHHPYTGGAHGVVTSEQGAFLSPIGPDGVLVLRPEGGGRVTSLISRRGDAEVNYYKLARLGHGPDGEVFACAGRHSGVFAVNFAGDRLVPPGFGHRFEGHDIIDVCSLNDPEYPFAVACLSRSRGIFFIRNVLEEGPPLALRADEIEGTGYTLLTTRGHLFVLTDKEFVSIPEVASVFLRGESLDRPIEIATIRAEYSEAFLVRDRSVLLAGEEMIAEFDIVELMGGMSATGGVSGTVRAAGDVSVSVAASLTSVRPRQFDPGWRRREIISSFSLEEAA